jgi:hypothetical protein
METKYALLNPADGRYEMFATEEEVKIKLAEQALSFYISHSHGVIYSKVTIDELGWETWENSDVIRKMPETDILNLIQENI